jgi:hypothetical protein
MSEEKLLKNDTIELEELCLEDKPTKENVVSDVENPDFARYLKGELLGFAAVKTSIVREYELLQNGKPLQKLDIIMRWFMLAPIFFFIFIMFAIIFILALFSGLEWAKEIGALIFFGSSFIMLCIVAISLCTDYLSRNLPGNKLFWDIILRIPSYFFALLTVLMYLL